MSTYKLSQSKGPSTRDLSAPTVPAAIANGGLRWADLQDPDSPVLVQVVLAPGTVFINDRIDLYWQKVPVATTPVKQEHLDVGVVTLPVFPSDILEHDDGPHILYYIATAVIGGGTTPSREATVEVKRLIPGGYDSDAGTEYINEDLAAPTGIPELINDEIAEQGLTVTIPVYINMAVGDRPQLDWGGQRLLHEPLTLEDVGKPVTFRVEKDVLILRPGPVNVRYEVRDKVNNWSKWSLSTITNVEAGDDLLAAPRVIDAINGTIDLAVLGDKDVRVQTPSYSDMNIDDEVVLTWAGETAEGVSVPVVQSTDVKEIGWPLDFDIPNEKVRAIAQGHAVVSYIVNPALGGPPKPSRRSPRIDVIGQTTNLPAPQVAGVIGDVLDPSTLPDNGATVTILANDLIKAGNSITLVWDGVTAGGTQLPYRDAFPVTGSMEGKDISRQISLTNITPLLNGSVTVSYVLSKEGVELPSDLVPLKIKSQSAQLPIPTIDFAQGDALNPDDVPASGTFVRINYSPMETSDRIEVQWDGVLDFTDFFPVPATWNNKEVVFPITKDYVDLNIGQTVEVYYTVTRAGVLLPASIKQPLLIGSALDLPVPSVKEAVGNSLEPIAAKDRLTVVVPHYTGMDGADKLTVTWAGTSGEGSYTSPTPIPVGTVGIKEIEILKSVVAFNLEKSVTVTYGVSRGDAEPKPSQPLTLSVLAIEDGNAELPKPHITEATENQTVLDLSTFEGDPTITVAPWPLIAEGQKVWLRMRGIKGGREYVIPLCTASGVGSGEVGAGLSKAVPRADLELLDDASSCTVELLVAFNESSGESEAVTFPVLPVTVKIGPVTKYEDFSDWGGTPPQHPVLAKEYILPNSGLGVIFVIDCGINKEGGNFSSEITIWGVNYADIGRRSDLIRINFGRAYRVSLMVTVDVGAGSNYATMAFYTPEDKLLDSVKISATQEVTYDPLPGEVIGYVDFDMEAWTTATCSVDNISWVISSS